MIGGTLLLATRSAGKLREIRPLLAPLGLHLLDLAEAELPEESDDELEAGSTFEENALAKARHYFTVSGGIPTVADDSGIEVSALRGQPGVRSKRWSGRTDLSGQALDDANNATLLDAWGWSGNAFRDFIARNKAEQLRAWAQIPDWNAPAPKEKRVAQHA